MSEFTEQDLYGPMIEHDIDLSKVMGHSKFNKNTIGLLLYAFNQGSTQGIAAEYAGISDSCLKEWLRRGRENIDDHLKHDVPLNAFGEFAKQLLQLRAQTALKYVDCFHQAAQKEWQAAAELLARRYPEEFGRRQVTTVEQNTKLTIEIKRTDDWAHVQGGRMALPAVNTSFTPDDEDG